MFVGIPTQDDIPSARGPIRVLIQLHPRHTYTVHRW